MEMGEECGLAGFGMRCHPSQNYLFTFFSIKGYNYLVQR